MEGVCLRLNFTLDLFSGVLERVCHTEEEIKYRVSDFLFVVVQVIKHMVPLICRILSLQFL